MYLIKAVPQSIEKRKTNKWTRTIGGWGVIAVLKG